MITSELSGVLFWILVFIVLYTGKWLVNKARENSMKNYEDSFCEACECDPCDCGFGSY